MNNNEQKQATARYQTLNSSHPSSLHNRAQTAQTAKNDLPGGFYQGLEKTGGLDQHGFLNL